MVDKHQRAKPYSTVDRSEGFGERLLGSLLDRAHQTPPHMIATLIEQEIAVVGGRDIEVLLQDGDADQPVQETVRLLSRALMRERGGVTSDDATLLLLEWRAGSADHVGIIDEPPAARG